MLAAARLKALLDDIGDLELRCRNIERYRKQAGHITHQTIALPHRTFITTLDRDEIHQLNTNMDYILDLMEDVAQCLFPYGVRAVTSEARRRPADLCVACIAKVTFGFLNGFHDAANSIASIVSTRVLRPPHTLIGGLAGAAVARGGYAAMLGNYWLSTLAIVASPLLGFHVPSGS